MYQPPQKNKHENVGTFGCNVVRFDENGAFIHLVDD